MKKNILSFEWRTIYMRLIRQVNSLTLTVKIFTVCLATILRHMYKTKALLVHKSVVYCVFKHGQ